MSDQIFTLLMGLPHRRMKALPGALIFGRGDPATALHLVLEGEVHLVRHRIDGAGIVLQRAVAGQILAEASLFAATNHCTAVAEGASVLAVIGKRKILTRMASDITFAEAFAAHLAREVREARLRAEILSMKRVADRVSAWLAWHDEALPERGRWHRIATEIGVSREALYRELARRRHTVTPSGRGQHESIRTD